MTIVFLDTCVLLDYIENRDRTVAHLIQTMIEDESIEIATSIFNIIELLDKVQEIRHMAKLVTQNKFSFDEIARDRQSKNLSESERNDILSDINKFQEDSSIIVYQMDKSKGYAEVVRLLSEINLKSQDALIVGSYSTSEAEIFVSKDSSLLKAIKNQIPNSYHVKNDMKSIKERLSIR
ncbi:hypothetical protein H6504_00490 [Candidatus Woesearchaeota archaeon]|nr:hypothetical protein [Candidatus Woesearchaeota archaeon]